MDIAFASGTQHSSIDSTNPASRPLAEHTALLFGEGLVEQAHEGNEMTRGLGSILVLYTALGIEISSSVHQFPMSYALTISLEDKISPFSIQRPL